eukprot:746317-Hanusia_phi.AAC.2
MSTSTLTQFLRHKNVVDASIFAAVSVVTVLIDLFLPDNLAIKTANALSRPYPTDNQYTPGSIQFHLQRSSQDATKTPACTSLYVITSAVYVYTIYLITAKRYQDRGNHHGYAPLKPDDQGEG